jgi:hypothetical protein
VARCVGARFGRRVRAWCDRRSTKCRPHTPQNLSPGSVGAAQAGQATASCSPHSEQKRRPARFSCPQAEQPSVLTGPPGSRPPHSICPTGTTPSQRKWWLPCKKAW